MKTRYRLQEWAAERFERVQYPRIAQINESKPERLMSLSQILGLFVVGCAGVVFGLIALAFVVFFFIPALFD